MNEHHYGDDNFPITFLVAGEVHLVERECMMTLRREDALDLLDWIGLPREDFGAIDARQLAPLCRRRLWPMPRNVDAAVHGRRPDGTLFVVRPAGTLRRWTEILLRLAEHAGQGTVTLLRRSSMRRRRSRARSLHHAPSSSDGSRRSERVETQLDAAGRERTWKDSSAG